MSTTVLVTSGGGHLQQMLSLLPRLQLPGDVVWVTPESGLSRDRLGDQRWYVIPYIPARDWRGALRVSKMAHRILRDCGARRIVSTGAAPAPPFFLAGAAMGLGLHYIESATRSDGPSLSGRLVSLVPGARLYTQYPHLADSTWQFVGSIFDPFDVVEVPERHASVKKVVVSLGTEKFGFRRAVDRLLKVLPEDADVLWQTGATDVSDLAIEAHESLPAKVLREAIVASDVFVSHAGTGSALAAFELGKRPLLLPREARFGEHVDDHQQLTATELHRRGLAVAVAVEDLSLMHLRNASCGRVIQDGIFRPFPLAGVPAPPPVVVLDLREPSSEAVRPPEGSVALGT